MSISRLQIFSILDIQFVFRITKLFAKIHPIAMSKPKYSYYSFQELNFRINVSCLVFYSSLNTLDFLSL